MPFNLHFAKEAQDQLAALRDNAALAKRSKAVMSALGKLENNPRHPSLNTHKFTTRRGKNGEEMFEAYAENNTPGAYRIFWYYGPEKTMISIIAITPHP